ncbi:zinc finger CCCH domain-containing protein 20-like, partial [Salvia hispanica]|uniref:zinc finger CCCH domain-containing protein 20-like n=1 Tax=Salvia hispanica TaxID=49212 RepID=UPI002009792B
IPVDAYSCDEFRMYEFKVKRCARARSHDWTECPFAHPGEKARRRDPRLHHYSGSACPDFRRGACRRGDACEHAHGVFECWLHPARYRTQPCKDGTHCRRRVCFFAHMPEQLRILPYAAADESPRAVPIGSSPRYSPPTSPVAASPPQSPLSQLTESIRGMQINNKMKLGLGMGMGMNLGMGLSMSPPSWGGGYGSPKIRPGFRSLPATPIRAVTRPGINAFDLWESSCEEEPAMERVESGRALRERIYSKLGKENSLNRVGEIRRDESGAPKINKVSNSGNYSMSDGGPTIELNMPDENPDLSSPKEESDGEGLIGHLRDLVEKDTLSLSEFELELHDEMIDYIRSSMRKNR